ncbi:hypothetical protein ES708_03681 [subsurface metagenome]
MATQMTIQQQTRELMDKAEVIVREAKEMVVQNKGSLTAAVDFLGKIAIAKKEVDSRRRFFVDPLNQQVKSINDLFRGYSDPLGEADRIVRNKVLVYQAEEARRVAEEQQRVLEEAKAQAEEASKHPAEEFIPIPINIVEEPEKTVRAPAGSATTRQVWTFKIVDLSQVPDEYKVIDEKKIAAVVKAGVRNIPGVEIYPTSSLVVTGRR